MPTFLLQFQELASISERNQKAALTTMTYTQEEPDQDNGSLHGMDSSAAMGTSTMTKSFEGQDQDISNNWLLCGTSTLTEAREGRDQDISNQHLAVGTMTFTDVQLEAPDMDAAHSYQAVTA